ncbi:hypothetical protein [Streptomyces sp. NPDC002952]|uniref:hypothetical protein n=1 Tax=Streptomyces sp. NPDC002952 TaxID=3364673 RepID=UPI0036995156
MKTLKHYGPMVLLLVAALLLLTACGDADDSSGPSSCYEIDVDHPKSKHPKTSKPSAPKAPAYRAPSTRKRR